MGKLKFYITIVACLLITIIGIIQDTPIFMLSIRLIIAIVLFYIIGGLIETYLKKKVFYSDNIVDSELLTAQAEDEGDK